MSDTPALKRQFVDERIVDVMEELCKFTLLTRGRADYLVDRYSERKAEGRIPHGAENATAAMAYEAP